MSESRETEVDGRTRRRLENGGRLFDAAMALMAERSYDDITIEEICVRAGVGRATFFRIYQTKADLLLEFNRRLAVRVERRLEEAEPTDVGVALFAVGTEIADTWTQATRSAAALAQDFSQMAGSRGLHASHPELLRLIVRVINDAVERGEIKASLPSSLLGSLALVQIAAPVSYWFTHPERDLHALIEDAIFQWLHGALASRRTSGPA